MSTIELSAPANFNTLSVYLDYTPSPPVSAPKAWGTMRYRIGIGPWITGHNLVEIPNWPDWPTTGRIASAIFGLQPGQSRTVEVMYTIQLSADPLVQETGTASTSFATRT